MLHGVAAIAQLNVDVLFSGFSKFPQLGEEVFADQFGIQLGGGPQAMLLTLHRAGIPTRFGTFIGKDVQSFLGIELLRQYGYESYQNLYDGGGHPAVITSVLSFPSDRAFLAYNEGVSDADLPEEDVYRFLKGSKVCFAPASEAVRQRLFEDGTAMVFDIGWHDWLCMDRIKPMLRFVDAFCPNEKEALKITGAPDACSALRQLAPYVPHPVVKTGKSGCITLLDGAVVEMPALEEFLPVDSTGAGDAFLAGVAFGLHENWDFADCVRMGNVLGGHATTGLGCLANPMSREEAFACFQRYFKE
ncbi:MAG TPA: carbohydrate kinase family protein [Feifaniaceae bacterium]|nr:carbohydrate kinase family protein [Feifaniaceae bacterium]